MSLVALVGVFLGVWLGLSPSAACAASMGVTGEGHPHVLIDSQSDPMSHPKQTPDSPDVSWFKSHKTLLMAAGALALIGALSLWTLLNEKDPHPPEKPGLGNPPADPVVQEAGS